MTAKETQEKYYCKEACGREVAKYHDRCWSCTEQFNKKFDEFRTMMEYIAGKSLQEQIDAINFYRSGEYFHA